MSTYEDSYGDFGPLHMSPNELDAMYKQLPPVADYIAAQDAKNAASES